MNVSNGQPPDAGATAAAVAGLAREVEALRRLVEQQARLAETVDELAGLVAELAEATANGANPAVDLTSWLDLPNDPHRAHTALVELVEWMRTVYLRYTDAAGNLPACWLWHPDVVEELLWLMQAWQAAYQSEHGSIGQAADWHDRWRPGVVKRIKTVAGTCSLEQHQANGDRPAASAPVVPVADAADLIGQWWATGRDTTPAPEPTVDQLASAATAGRVRPSRAGGRR